MSFEAFYRDQYRPLLALAVALTMDGAAAEDLVQEAFLSAHRRWDRVSQYDRPHAWLRRVLVNRATSRRRRLGSEARALTRLGRLRDVEPDLSPETAEVWTEVGHLPSRQRQAVALHYVAELSVNETADVMGCSEGAVKSHLHRARRTLEARLAAWNQEES